MIDEDLRKNLKMLELHASSFVFHMEEGIRILSEISENQYVFTDIKFRTMIDSINDYKSEGELYLNTIRKIKEDLRPVH